MLWLARQPPIVVSVTDPTRIVRTQYLPDGSLGAKTYLSPISHKMRGRVIVPPSRVVPIVFVPGIMGSNLMARADIKLADGKRGLGKNSSLWNADSETSLAGWLWKDPAYRQLVLNKDVVVVDDRGKIAQGFRTETGPFGSVKTPAGETLLSKIPVALARKRGWGTVSWAFYGSFLDWLQAQMLNVHCTPDVLSQTFKELMTLVATTPPGAPAGIDALRDSDVRHLANMQFPVHAVGYNWLQSNLDSGGFLADKIRKDIIPTYHGVHGQTCEQVIVVTHSMGGLVARAAAVHAKASDCILGVIHGAMPTDGAAAFYKRLAAGFGSEGGGIMGGAQSLVLGRTAQDTTPVIAYNPGPLELAPNKRYNGGKPWLFIKAADGGRVLKALPEKGDPYAEIYARTDVAWRAVIPEWLNPAQRRGSNAYWESQYQLTLALASKFHEVVGGRGHLHTYAHYSADKGQTSWGNLSWRAEAGEPYSRLAASGQAPLASSSWIADRTRRLESPDGWRQREVSSTSVRFVQDSIGVVRLVIDAGKDAGDATVPAAASAAQVASLEGCRLACSHNPGYEHAASYNSEVVRKTVLDAVIRLVKQVKIDR